VPNSIEIGQHYSEMKKDDSFLDHSVASAVKETSAPVLQYRCMVIRQLPSITGNGIKVMAQV